MKQYTLLIGGEHVATPNHAEVRNPSTGEVVGLMPLASEADLDRAVAAAANAFQTWSRTGDAERAAACRAIANKLSEHAEELARLLTLEQGKPFNGLGSRFELGGAMAWTRHTAELGLPVEVVRDDNEGRVEIHRKPIGVTGSITPWNWPVMITCWHIIPAVRTGNTVVIKPSPLTPLSTIRLVEIINEVLPAGVVNVVTGENSIGAALSAHPGIAKMTFTGSTETGRKIMASAAATLKRLYVHDHIYDDVCRHLTEYAANIIIGDGLDEKSVLGPVQNAMQFNKVRELVDDARAKGARILIGGEAAEGPGYFYPITLVADIDNGTRLVDEEQFGPVLPIIRYSDIDEVIRRANDNPSGLGGSVWSSDVEKARAVALQLECGSVWINKHGAIQPNAPFGGVKQSGIGVEFGTDGLKEFTTIQTVLS